MGVALAEEARRRGADVTLLAANRLEGLRIRHIERWPGREVGSIEPEDASVTVDRTV
jgi:NADPH-dependent 2,4-dienoyl-CoA reductase/sulfur reductase-like enzyme